jgi:sugar phosphate isomerase/epimerase
MVGRFFGRHTGGNWRPPAEELAFASEAGFDTVQIRSNRPGEIEDELGARADELGAMFDDFGLEPVLEMLVRHEGERGTLAQALQANLAAIEAIGVLRVHIHPVGPLESAPLLAPDFEEALPLAEEAGLLFGVEHNPPGHFLFEPDDVHGLLESLPRLGFVWDVNHTRPEDLGRFLALREWFTLVHVSDTPLPETNHHLPLGRGNVDLTPLRSLDDVPLVLEIGGLPHSGGPGLDSDDALRDSLARLRAL